LRRFTFFVGNRGTAIKKVVFSHFLTKKERGEKGQNSKLHLVGKKKRGVIFIIRARNGHAGAKLDAKE